MSGDERRRPDHVVVVGGGITGLVAAYRLSQAGSEVTVIEPGRIGGKVQTSVFAGRPVDEGADNFLLRVPWALALCHDLELDGELVSPVERSAHVFVDGARHTIPAGHVLGVPTDLSALAASGIVSPAGVERARQDLDLPADPADPAVAGGDVALGPYLRRRLGDEVVDRLIDPLLGGINAGDTTLMSLAAVVPQLDAAARSGDPSLIRSCLAQRDAQARSGALPSAGSGAVVAAIAEPAPAGAPPVFAAPLGGMARIVDALLALMPAVDVRQGRRVVELRGAGDAPAGAGRPRVTLDDGTVLEPDAVVLATPAHVSGPLLAEVSAEASATLSAIDHSSVAMLTIAVDRQLLGSVEGASGCLVPRDQGTLMTAVSYATSKWAQLRDPDRDDVILRASAGRVGDERQRELDDAALTEAVLADLDRVVGLHGQPREIRVGRWDRSLPQYAPGHLDRIDAVEAALEGSGIVLAGMALRGVGIPACVRSAELAAASLGATWPTRRGLAR
jgi:oxygen-dependent protoporphyrinogen oxidase